MKCCNQEMIEKEHIGIHISAKWKHCKICGNEADREVW